MELNGWHPDPFEIHEERFLKNGEATALIRDNGIGAYDEPPGSMTAVVSPPPPPPPAPVPGEVPAPETVTELNGWHPDPFEIHEERFLKNGEATALVRDNGIGAYDEPPGSMTAVVSPPPAPVPDTAPPPPAVPAPETVTVAPEAPAPAPAPAPAADRPATAISRTCPRCGAVLGLDATVCENCAPRQDSETGWFQDPAGRWESRFFDGGEMTNQVRVAGGTYLDSKRNFADADESRIEAILFNGERLLHEAWVYNNKRGILALTSYRVLKYHTGRGDRSTRSGTGPLELDWELAWNPRYLDLVRQGAAAGERRAEDLLRTGINVLADYESGPFTKVGRSDPELVGSQTITLWHRVEVNKDQGEAVARATEKDPPGPVNRLLRRLGDVVKRGNKAGSHPQSASPGENQAMELQLVGRTPTLLRIDELLAAAAPT